MKIYQRILIGAHAALEKSGWLDSKFGFFIYVKSYYFYKRFFEARPLVRLLKVSFKLIDKNNFIFVDIGCHIGFVSTFVSQNRSEAKVISVDPDNRNIMMFAKINNGKLQYSNLTLKNLAVWEFDGSIPFTFERSNTANNRFDSNAKDFVECLSVDTLLNEFKNNMILMKIDVQGFELEVLNGSLETLRKNVVFIILELDHSAMNSRGSSSRDLLNKLRILGYSAWNDSTNSHYLEEELSELLDRRSCTDLLFVPEDLSDLKNKVKM